ncbi:MAG TPA: hypothetical protein DEF27_04840 [Oscillatoriales bacterium UBA8482]|nr:MAG: hypothetical protein AUK43_06580 [Oscillatoriales cyanobacterium CG2_30_40_61]HBW57149.1 hypothetical protein [Oscillatoriales bacterium UBA8482]
MSCGKSGLTLGNPPKFKGLSPHRQPLINLASSAFTPAFPGSVFPPGSVTPILKKISVHTPHSLIFMLF